MQVGAHVHVCVIVFYYIFLQSLIYLFDFQEHVVSGPPCVPMSAILLFFQNAFPISTSFSPEGCTLVYPDSLL